ncbi:MAG: class I SAM-dependent methyltransferase [Fibromonadaceae bacterium]|nr:class I SAM-dependent methyltransferase [Fibromonadaceae bacterium]
MFYDFYLNRPAGALAKAQAKRLIPALAKPALKGLPNGLYVLEIGVGRGDFAQYFKSIGANYTGIEANKILCDRLNEQGFNVICYSVPPFPQEFEKESFELVVMCHIFEHFMDYREALKVLSEIFSLLKPGGRMLLFHPDYLDWKTDYFDGDYSHSLILTRNRVDNLAQDAGFKVIHKDGFRSFFSGFKPLTWCLARFMNCFAGLLLCITGSRKFFKPKIAFNLNLLTVCEKINEN